jgi:raffinose/stachyose/melibiose transport system permease protein
MTKLKNDWVWVIVLLGPALLVYLVFMWLPTGIGLYQSLFRWRGVTNNEFVGLRNYEFLLQSRFFRHSIWVTLRYMLWSVGLQIPAAYILAYLLYSGVRGYRFFRFLFFVPVVLLTVAVGIMFNYLFSRAFGMLAPVAEALGFEYFDPLAREQTALVTAVLADWWKWLGVKIMLFYAGFQNLPTELLEAAAIDGAKKTAVFFRIVIPLTWETITLVVTLLVIGSLKVFDLLYVMTAGGPNHATSVITIHLVQTAFDEQNFGSGSAIAVIMFVLSLGITLMLRRGLQQTKFT